MRRGSHLLASRPIISERQVLQSCIRLRQALLCWHLIARPGLTVKSRATRGADPVAQGRRLRSVRHQKHRQTTATIAARKRTATSGPKSDRHERATYRQANNNRHRKVHSSSPGKTELQTAQIVLLAFSKWMTARPICASSNSNLTLTFHRPHYTASTTRPRRCGSTSNS